MAQIVGRKREQEHLMALYHSNKSEFVAIYGRRRVGKTFLITQTFKENFAFSHTGVSPFDSTTTITMKDQLMAFHYSLLRNGQDESVPMPSSWQEAFYRLEQLLEKKADGKKQVVFIDELPWMDSSRSKFISAFESFYNGWAAGRDNILLIICGSSSSWIIKNIINSRGGLYNRLTSYLRLLPFNLKETEDFLRLKGITIERYDVVKAFMALGGIPYYLDYFKPGLSVEQNIDAIFFKENAPLKDEFSRLFNTLFYNSERYVKIITALSKRNYGYSKKELSEATDISVGGGLTDYLKCLAETDFIEAYTPVMTKREEYYRLKDCFCIFYLKYVRQANKNEHNFWQNSSQAKSNQSWQGIAFEQICLSHIQNIKNALGISGIVSTASSLIIATEEKQSGTQIDLVIKRADRNVNLCEIKFYSSEVIVEKEDSLKLRNRIDLFKSKSHFKGNVIPTLITTFGLKYNTYSGIYQKVLTLDDLFG